jgi:DNA repair protein RadA/Sms
MVEAIVPASGKLPENIEGMRVVRVHSLGEAVAWLMDKK